jgi:hypothetical protein
LHNLARRALHGIARLLQKGTGASDRAATRRIGHRGEPGLRVRAESTDVEVFLRREHTISRRYHRNISFERRPEAPIHYAFASTTQVVGAGPQAS